MGGFGIEKSWDSGNRINGMIIIIMPRKYYEVIRQTYPNRNGQCTRIRNVKVVVAGDTTGQTTVYTSPARVKEESDFSERGRKKMEMEMDCRR